MGRIKPCFLNDTILQMLQFKLAPFKTENVNQMKRGRKKNCEKLYTFIQTDITRSSYWPKTKGRALINFSME